ncbi:uncharacterized protein LOC114294059 [Camellia sinensis]|uniref:uncharacterized protein LOC114294059 n=1 Tax=Camellia sinensis TaxID=4442 RepID=UPI001035C2C3|nr:uncharacterized protein LOC114294059 [Camellia sinensis]
MGMYFNCMGFTASTHVDPIGRSGGILMIWNPKVMNVRVMEASSQQITTIISRQDFQDWVLSAVYASPNSNKRDELWEQLTTIAQSMDKPWLVAGDFNDFSSSNEKRSLQGSNTQSINQDLRRGSKFNDRLNIYKLMDLGCAGPRLTWSNNRKGWANTIVRLERALCNTEWRITFLDGAVKNLPRTYSDHSPLMVLTQGKPPFNPVCRPFKFMAAWLTHENFKAIVENSWTNTTSSLSEKLNDLAQVASTWNKEIFGNIFRRKRWLIGRIEGIQKSQATNYFHNLHRLELELIEQYNHVLYQEELLWFQKSRAKWITQGERNTKYFHLTTLAKRRKRKIEMLKNDNGMWVDQPEQLKVLITNYFMNLFGYTPSIFSTNWSNLVSCKLNQVDNAALTNVITNEEVWNAVKNINAFKAPGRDRFQAVFYHIYWSIVGASVCDFVKNCFLQNHIPRDVNRTLIALIPKIDNLESVKQFRPVFYKIISKIIVNRLRPLLSKIVRPNQSSFILGKNTSDNIIITQEIIHSLNKKKGIHSLQRLETRGPLVSLPVCALSREATTSNYSTIMKVIDEFCDISGLKINHHKFKLFVSPNIDRKSAKEMSTKCGIPLTFDLGQYLGVPIIPGRVNRGIFTHILDKMQRRLTGWKTHTLSMVGRATLIQSVASAIPAYAMQTMLLPAKQKSRDASYIWRGIISTRPFLRKGVKWNISDGKFVNVWKDWWCGNSSFEDTVSGTMQSNIIDAIHISTLRGLLGADENWDDILIKDKFPHPLATIILGTPPLGNNEIDTPIWKGSPGREFTVSFVYEMLQDNENRADDWSWVWKLRLPQKLKGFLWTVLHGKLLTNQMRLKRGLTDTPHCLRCNGVEDMNHLFRECYIAKEVWLIVFDKQWYIDMIRRPWMDWLMRNAKSKNYYNAQLSWFTVFVVALLKIWKNRNGFVFEGKSISNQESAKFIFDYSREIHQAFLQSVPQSRPSFRLIKWCFPPTGRLKLNTDGSRKTGEDGGFGRLIRDERGAWVCGYYGRLQLGTSLEAELWALYKGLIVILQKGMNNVIIESDAMQVV